MSETAPAPTTAPEAKTALGANPTSSWTDSLPDDLKSNPSITKYKDVSELAKGYVNAQSLIGKKGLEAPDDSWDEAKWGDFYNKLGRPETPDKYDFKDVQTPEGYQVHDGMKTHLIEKMHKAGLNNRQAKALYNDYVAYSHGMIQQQKTAEAERQQKGLVSLKEKWGSNFDSKISDARKAARTFGGDDMVKWLEETGMGNEPHLIEFFGNLGVLVKEDSASGGGSGSFNTGGVAAAKKELSALQADPEFMKALNTRNHPGHNAAVQRQLDLLRVINAS